MAGLAPQQRGGMNATTIGMIVSIVVNVALLVTLIILLTGQEDLRTKAEQAQTAKNRIANSADESTARTLVPDAGGPGAGGKTLVGEMNSAMKTLLGRLTGNVNDKPTEALAKLDAVLATIAQAGKVDAPDRIAGSVGAVAIIQQLHEWFVAERTAKEEAIGGLAKANRDLEAAIATNKSLEDKFGQDLAELNGKVADMQKAKSEFERIKNDEIQALGGQISAKTEQLNSFASNQLQMRQDFAKELRNREDLIRLQMAALGTMKGEGDPAAQPLALARKPIGKVLRALPGDALVHINVGRSQRATLGMTFSIYSADRRVPESGHGKATIEVVSLGENTSECRVVVAPSPDDPILPGDLAGNIVLARSANKKQKFVIVGEFDLDHDGVTDPRGAAAIRALVERYGGVVAEDVDATTDYLIVGREPSGATLMAEGPPPAVEAPAPVEAEEEAAPEASDSDDADEDATGGESEEEGDKDEMEAEKPPPARAAPAPPAAPARSEVDPTAGPRGRRVLNAAERFELAVRRATSLAVPRLNQDHFLNFVGIEPGQGAAKRLLP